MLISIGFRLVVHEFEEKYRLEDSKEINESLDEILLIVKKLQEKVLKWKEDNKIKNDDKEYHENLRYVHYLSTQ